MEQRENADLMGLGGASVALIRPSRIVREKYFSRVAKYSVSARRRMRESAKSRGFHRAQRRTRRCM